MRVTIALLALGLCLTTSRGVQAKSRKNSSALEVEYRLRKFDRVVNFANAAGAAVSTLDKSRYDYFRFVQRNYFQFDKRWSLDVEVPYITTNARGQLNVNGALTNFDQTTSGLQSIIARPRYYVKDPASPSGGYTLELTLRIDSGTTSLDPNQQQILNFIREGGLSSFDALFSKGFDVFLDNVWLRRWGRRKTLETRLGYGFTGSYSPVTDIPTRIDPSDQFQASLTYVHLPYPKQRFTYAVRGAFYTDATLSSIRTDTGQIGQPAAGARFITGSAPNLDHDPDVAVNVAWDQRYSKRRTQRVAAYVSQVGQYDLLTAPASVVRAVDPGEQYGVSYEVYLRPSRWVQYSLGAKFDRIEEIKAGGTPVANSERKILTFNPTFSRTYRGGAALTAGTEVGLSPDAPDVTARAGYSVRW